MTSAIFQPFSEKHIINIRCYDGYRVRPRIIIKRNITFFMYKNLLYLIWKSIVFSFNKAIEDLKTNFNFGDNVISDKLFKRFIAYEYKLQT